MFAAALWGLIGIGGVAYAVIVARRNRIINQSSRIGYFMLAALAAYAVLRVMAVSSHTSEAPFAVEALALLFLFLGCDNAWDTIADHIFANQRKTDAERS
jgi:hypothetical protein